LSAALLIVVGIALVQRSRGSNRGRAGSRHSSGLRIGSRLVAAPDPRFAAASRFASDPRFASNQGARFAAAPQFASGPQFATAPQFAAARQFALAPPGAFAPALRIAPGLRIEPDPRIAPDLRIEPDLRIAPDLRIEPGLRISPEPSPAPGSGDHVAAQVDPRPGPQPGPGVASPATSWTVGQPLSISVLASFTEEADSTRPSFAPSNSGDAFPTRIRAASVLGGHVLATLGIFVLSLASTPIGHHISHVGNTSIGSLARLCVVVGFAFAVVAAARVQHDIMGGGWYGGFPIRYISPQVALYVISPSGVGAAARRLNFPPARLILVEYGLLAASVLIVLDRFTAR
jgi:hypothetical protein